jgi:hypothetical protein
LRYFGLRRRAPAAEGDHRTPLVQDREHDAIAEPVVAAPAFAVDHQARVLQRRVRIAREHPLQVLPAVRGVADAEARRDLAGEPAALQVLDRIRRGLELLPVVVAGLLHDLVQVGTRFGFLRARLELGHLHADRFGQVLHRVDVAEPLVLHQERDGVAVHAAAEAVIELLGGADGERGRLLGVEGTAGEVVRTALLQRNVALDHVDDVDAMEQFLLERIWNHVRDAMRCAAAASAPCRMGPAGPSLLTMFSL